MDSAITTFIFDFGNVFVKWDIHALYNRFFPNPQAVDSFLEEIRFHEWNAHQDAGRPFKDGIAILSEKYPHYADLIQAYDTHWEDSITDMYHGTVEILRRLKGEGWPIYLLSNFSAEKFPLMRERYEFLNLFDDMIISGEHKLIKPDPAIFQLTLERINRKASECLFIDDSLANIETARNMGFHTIHFQSPEQLERDLKIW
ncbi:MAG TPA: HAD family phosphatase [Anaerolineales bacterium]|nr:HAD family phosphatase [Anaerolineales bacterium]